MEYLEPKIEKNSAVLGKSDVAFETRISVLVSTLAMVTLFKKYQTKLPREHVLTLLRCLSLEVDPTGQKCTMYKVVLDEFSKGLRRQVVVKYYVKRQPTCRRKNLVLSTELML